MLAAARQVTPTAAGIVAAIPVTGELVSIFAWFAIVALAAVGGIYLMMAVRRWSQREESPVTFTIQDLRDMRDRGEISAAEFSAMRATILAQLEPAKPAGPPAPRAGGDETDKAAEGDGSSSLP